MERSEHAATIKTDGDSTSAHLRRRCVAGCERLVDILRADFRDQAFAPLAGPNAKTLHGRLGQLHSYGANRLDSKGSILLLRLLGTLAGGLATQFWSTSGRVRRSPARRQRLCLR